MIEILDKADNCISCHTDKWTSPEKIFRAIHIGNKYNGTRINLCQECMSNLVTKLLGKTLDDELAKQHGAKIQTARRQKKNG